MLTKENIRTITETIDKAEITFSHLRDDLIDHVCCEVEYQLEQGLDFKQAFEGILNSVGVKDLQQVQENTLLLIDKIYCIMKTTMKISGVVSTSLLMIAAMFKLNHWQGGSILLLTGFVMLCFLFLPSAIYLMHKEGKEKKRPLLYVSAFLASFTFIIGVMFKLFHWPGAGFLLLLGGALIVFLFFPLLLNSLLKKTLVKQEKWVYLTGISGAIVYIVGLSFKLNHWPGGQWLLILGMVLIAFIFLPLYAKQNYKDTSNIKLGFIYLVVSLVWFILTTSLLTIRNSNTVDNQYNVIGSEVQESVKAIRAYEGFKPKRNSSRNIDTVNEKPLLKARQLDAFIQEIKINLISRDGEENLPAKSVNGEININKVGVKLSKDATARVLLGENNSGKAYLLKSMIEEFKQVLLQNGEGAEASNRFIGELFDTQDVVLPDGRKVTWEDYHFRNTTLARSLITLSVLQRNILTAEVVINQ